MADFDWRVWAYSKLSLLSVRVYGPGSLVGTPPERPFVLYRLETEIPGPYPGVSRANLILFVHDAPGDFMAIDAVLGAAKGTLVGDGQVDGLGAIACRWESDSGDLADEGFKTIYRTSSYSLMGRSSNG